MHNEQWLSAVTFLFAILLIAVLAWLTRQEPVDRCANTQADVGAAVLADEPGDQEALVNRAIIMKGDCEPEAQ